MDNNRVTVVGARGQKDFDLKRILTREGGGLTGCYPTR